MGLSPKAAARRIITMVGDGKAANADEAVAKDPELEPGLALVKKAAKPSRGNGSAIIERSW